MLYLVGFVLFFLFLTLLFLSQRVSKQTKVVVALLLIVITVVASVYTWYQKQKDEQIRTNYAAFKMGKSIFCNGIEVNSSRFTYSEGTQTFIGKKGSDVYTTMLSLRHCSK